MALRDPEESRTNYRGDGVTAARKRQLAKPLPAGPLSSAETALLPCPLLTGGEGWIDDMNDKAKGFDQADVDILNFDVSDEALEAASSTASGPAVTFATPTVSIVFACCGND
jgi:hypothetical protein